MTVEISLPPTVGEITTIIDPDAIGIKVSASADFADPGFLDTHTAVWDWGDTWTTEGTVSEVDGSGPVTGSHAYDTPGIYTVALTVTDDGDRGSSTFQYVVVYDPGSEYFILNYLYARIL